MSELLRSLVRVLLVEEFLLAESKESFLSTVTYPVNIQDYEWHGSGEVLATSQQDGYTMEIVDLVGAGSSIRRGTKFITSPSGEKVFAGYWIDAPEKGYFDKNDKKNRAIYAALPVEKRAQAEAKIQLTYAGLAADFARRKSELTAEPRPDQTDPLGIERPGSGWLSRRT